METIYKIINNEKIYIEFTKQEIRKIKEDIISGLNYSDIAEKWDISNGLVSSINNGKVWYDEQDVYPLCIKGHSTIHNEWWIQKVQQDLIYSNLSLKDISQKYNKAYSTIKKINSGKSHHKDEYNYPLTSNRK